MVLFIVERKIRAKTGFAYRTIEKDLYASSATSVENKIVFARGSKARSAVLVPKE